MEVFEGLHEACEGEVDGAEAHDCEDVGGVDDEGVLGDGEDGGDGVDGEEDVGGFDDDEDHEEGCGPEAFVFSDEEAFAFVVGGYREEFAEDFEDKILFWLDFIFVSDR